GINGYYCTNGGMLQPVDNCQFVKNPNQANNDKDAMGDLCDPDDDNDTVDDFTCTTGVLQLGIDGYYCTNGGMLQPLDNCQFDVNTNQTDTDMDGQGDVCDDDDDNDGLSDATEAMLGTDPLSKDTDGDTIPDDIEVCPSFGPCDLKT